MTAQPDGMKIATLGEVCTFKYGKSLAAKDRTGRGNPVYGSNGVVGFHDAVQTDGPAIVIGRKGSYGEVNFASKACWPIDTTYFIDRTCTDLNLEWLKHLLPTLGLNTMNRSAAIPGLNREDAYRIPIAVPSSDEQRRIAAILDKADELRTKRGQALVQLDTFTHSIFHDMFGDVSLNDRKWEEGKKLADVAEVSSGITKGRKTSGKGLMAVPYMAVSNVQDMSLNLKTVKYIDATAEEIDRLRLRRNDLLLTEGGDPDKLGRGTLWTEPLPLSIHQNHVFRVRVIAKHEVHPLFLNWLVSSSRGKSYFLKSAKQTTGIASINMTQLKAFPLLMPPFRLQAEFAKRVAVVDRLKEHHRAQLAELDALFAVLQHRAFKGEL